jgi:hypothetical protein
MVLALSLFACLKGKEPIKAPSPMDLPMIAVLDRAQQPQELPEELLEAIQERLARRDINAAFSATPASFESHLLSSQRIQALDQYPILLIETEAQFYSQLNGRFRWEVDLRLTLATSEEQSMTRQRIIPVFHQYHHQRETEALLAAEALILRELDLLLDDYLRGIGR